MQGPMNHDVVCPKDESIIYGVSGSRDGPAADGMCSQASLLRNMHLSCAVFWCFKVTVVCSPCVCLPSVNCCDGAIPCRIGISRHVKSSRALLCARIRIHRIPYRGRCGKGNCCPARKSLPPSIICSQSPSVRDACLDSGVILHRCKCTGRPRSLHSKLAL